MNKIHSYRLDPRFARGAGLLAAALLAAPASFAQDDAEEEIFELSPFTVEGSENVGYRATSTLAGTRIRTDLKDVGSAISVVTEQFLQDVNATSNETLLMYTPSMEVGGTHSPYQGNYSGGSLVDESGFNSPSQNTRVRGLASADNTFNYFLSDVPWDGYVVSRVDMQRGPNSILFGLGSPAGIINATTDSAAFENSGQVEFQFGSYGSTRLVVKANRVLLKDQLAVAVAGLRDDERFRQEEAFEDDERLYFALRYDPSFANTDTTSTSFEGNYERGSVNANRPRNLPPIDRITAFFNPEGHIDGGLGGRLAHPLGRNDDSGRYGLGESKPEIKWNPETNQPIPNDGSIPNPYFSNVYGNFGRIYGSPVMIFGSQDSGDISGPILDSAIGNYNGIGTDGERDGTFHNPFSGLSAPNPYKYYAEQQKLPFYQTGGYKERSITDPTIFDFYNHLIDGPNKEEGADFKTLNLSFRQTFASNQVGYEVSYFNQSYNDSRLGQFSGENQAIYIDTNSHLIDGSVNPNAGRPFLTDNYRYGNGLSESKREALRATAFAEYDFQRSGEDNWINRLLGKHVFTGMYVEDNNKRESRSFTRYGLPDEFAAWQQPDRGPGKQPYQYDSNDMSLNSVHYLGGSLLGRASASGANIPGLAAAHVPTSGQFWTFNDTWNAPNVDPAAPWTPPSPGPIKTFANGSSLVDSSTQSENPANYVGWQLRDLPIYDVLETGMVDNYTDSASLTRSEIVSEALVWQGRFWDGSVVGTYGWRRDRAARGVKDAPARVNSEGQSIGYKNVDPDVFRVDGMSKLEGETQSWSVAAHVDRMIGADRLPFGLSLYYNKSENFQPAAGRVNLYNEALPPPSGETTDVSVLLSTRDNRYTLKATKYETSIANAGVDRLSGTWFIGGFYALGTSHANKYAYDLATGDTLAGQALDRTRDPQDQPWSDDGYNMVGLTAEQEKAITDSWYAFLAATPQKFYDAWSFEGIGGEPASVRSQEPSGLTYTQDTISKGYEFEFTAQPTDNWRISANATKTEAVRQNVGGEALKEWVALVDEYMAGPAGDIRIWWGSESAPSLRSDFVSAFRNEYALTQLLEGQNQPDLRQWNFSVVTNYDFKDGMLNGFNVGGSYRWHDKSVIGYSYMFNEDGQAVHDLDKPYYGPTEEFFDMWVGYGKQLTDDIHWRMQINVRNLFSNKEDLIPLNTQPDGRVGAYRIPPMTTWTVSNTFSF